MSGPLRIERVIGHTVGWRCDDCSAHHISIDVTRERARIHAFTRGHTVRFIVEAVTIYSPAGAR